MKTPYQLKSNANISIENLGIMHCINFACYNKKEGNNSGLLPATFLFSPYLPHTYKFVDFRDEKDLSNYHKRRSHPGNFLKITTLENFTNSHENNTGDGAFLRI